MDAVVKKKIIAGIAVAVLIAAGIVAAVIMKSPSKEVSESEIQAGPGQEIVYATIDEITGNDIEVSLLEEDMVKQFSSAGRTESEDDKESQRGGFGDGNMPDMEGGMPDMSGGFPGGDFSGGAGGFPGGGGMPDMSGGGFPGGSGGGMPDMSGGGFPGGSGGGMPDMSGAGGSDDGASQEDSEDGMPDMSGGFPGGGFPGEMPEGFGGQMPDMEGMPEGGMQMPPFGQEAEEKKASYRIPVGTDVITTLGATTTFSHLEEGDTIAILLDQESGAILKVWMVM